MIQISNSIMFGYEIDNIKRHILTRVCMMVCQPKEKKNSTVHVIEILSNLYLVSSLNFFNFIAKIKNKKITNNNVIIIHI